MLHVASSCMCEFDPLHVASQMVIAIAVSRLVTWWRKGEKLKRSNRAGGTT